MSSRLKYAIVYCPAPAWYDRLESEYGSAVPAGLSGCAVCVSTKESIAPLFQQSCSGPQL